MRLNALTLNNFRGFEDFNLKFHPNVTAIAGINGSGKTSILDAAFFLLRTTVKRSSHGFTGMDFRNDASSGYVRLDGAINSADGFHCEVRFEQSSWHKPDIDDRPFQPLNKNTGPLPIWLYYKVERHIKDSTPGSTNPGVWPAEKSWHPVTGNTNLAEFFHWFREREDLENEERRDSPSYLDHQLEAVRKALVTLLPGYESPRIRRPRFGAAGNNLGSVERPVLTIVKAGRELAFDQLSEGERTTAGLVCDIARRLAIANPKGNPLEGTGVVFVDEIELHLHPKWQAQIIPSLGKTFPNLQFVMTTHSPIVLSYIDADSVRLIKDFRLVEHTPMTRGREPNSVLIDIFESPLRPKEIEEKLGQLALLIDQENLTDAKQTLATLRDTLGSDDPDIIRLNTMIEFLDT